LDYLLHDLCHYYATINTKRQLNLEMPANCFKSSYHKQKFQEFNPPSTQNSSASHDLHHSRSVDKPSSCLPPTTITMSEDLLHASIDFRCIDAMKRNFGQLYLDTVRLDSLPADTILDTGA
jgi:hypothetical protein